LQLCEYVTTETVSFRGVAKKLRLRECVAARDCSKQQDRLQQTNGDRSWYVRA